MHVIVHVPTYMLLIVSVSIIRADFIRFVIVFVSILFQFRFSKLSCISSGFAVVSFKDNSIKQYFEQNDINTEFVPF